MKTIPHLKKSLFSALLCLLSVISLAQSNSLTCDLFYKSNYSGDKVSLLYYSGVPDVSLPTIESKSVFIDYDTSYVSRMHGWLLIEESGEYDFFISGNDAASLYISTDTSKQNLEYMCGITDSTHCDDFTQFEEQKGRRFFYKGWYYFCAVHEQTQGGDCMSVSWKPPGQSVRSIIPGSQLSSTPLIDQEANEVLDVSINEVEKFAYKSIDDGTNNIILETTDNIDVSQLAPVFIISQGATISPENGSVQDFTSVVTYTVTSASGTPQVWKVDVKQIPVQSGNDVELFHLKELQQDAFIDKLAGTISIDYFAGYSEYQNIVVELSKMAVSSIDFSKGLNLSDLPVSFIVTAQDGTEKEYTIMANVIDGIRFYTDDFSTDTKVFDWNTDAHYDFTHNAIEEVLEIDRMHGPDNYTDLDLLGMYNLYGATVLRFKAKADVPIINPGINFALDDGSGLYDYAAEASKITEVDSMMEFFVDFSDNGLLDMDYGRIEKLIFEIDRESPDGIDAIVKIDDFRLGVEAYLNNAPKADDISNPDWIDVSAGEQTIALTGIDDGNPNRAENITITAKSNNQAVVADADIFIDYDGTSQTASVRYTPAGGQGIATITLYLQDDRGVVYTGEQDLDSLSFIVDVRNPAFNNQPSIGETTFEVLVGKGQQALFIPDVSDGDDDKVQKLTFTQAVSSNSSVLTVDSLVLDTATYTTLLYVTDHDVIGDVNVNFTIKDDGGTAGGGVDSLEVKLYVSVADPVADSVYGANFQYYDIAHWQPRPDDKSVPSNGSYQIISETNTPIEKLEKDFFWCKMYGYILPKVSGDYIFSGYSNEGFHFFMNLENGFSAKQEDLTLMCEYVQNYTSDPITLEANHPYYFTVYGRDIIGDFPLYLKWEGPGIAEDYIQKEYLLRWYDYENPTEPENLRVIKRGVNEMLVTWSPATDDIYLLGYNVYCNGRPVAKVHKDTTILINNLNEDTKYTISVEAVDEYYNKSLPVSLNVKTYPVESGLPPVPDGLVDNKIASDAVELGWNAVVDAETEIRGYNVFVDGVKVNDQPVIDTFFVYNSLQPETYYDLTVSAMDANYNESAQSSALNIFTGPFIPCCNWPLTKKAVVSFDLVAIDQFVGFGLQTDISARGFLQSNKILYSAFEDSLYFGPFLDGTDKKVIDCTFSLDENTPFAGKRSAKITGEPGGILRSNLHTQIHSDHFTYLIRFAMKKDATYSGEVAIKLSKLFDSPAYVYKTVIPTTDWQQYELEVNPGYVGVNTEWILDFVLLDTGAIYIDNLEFHNASYYNENSKFSSKALELIEGYNASGMRWGGINVNSKSFYTSSGTDIGSQLTIADFVDMCNNHTQGKYAFITAGVSDNSDYYTSPEVFSTLIDYLAGDAGTQGGAIRNAEGYSNLLSSSNGVLIEFGNEVWGSNSHDANIGSDYSEYGAWARERANYCKQSSFWDASKMQLAYSGRNLQSNYGLHQDMLSGAKKEINNVALSGYLGTNLAYCYCSGPYEELYYEKNNYEAFVYHLKLGMEQFKKDAIWLTGDIMPGYFYEGNITRSNYFGSFGQALTHLDYYTLAQRSGIGHTVVFGLVDNQWAITDNTVERKPLAAYTIGAEINKHCKGINLETEVKTNRKIYNSNNQEIDLDPVGAYVFSNEDKYSLALFSRDFEADYKVLVDLPDTLNIGSKAVLHTITGESNYRSKYANVQIDTITDFTDSLIVDLPKHSFVLLSFTGTAYDYGEVPLVNTDFEKASSVEIVPENGITEISSYKGFLNLDAIVSPDSAFVKKVNWQFVDNTIGMTGGPMGNQFVVIGGEQNGTVVIRATAVGDTAVYDEITISYTGADIPPFVKQDNLVSLQLYPVPAKDILSVKLFNANLLNATIEIVDAKGVVMDAIDLDSNNCEQETFIDLAGYESGIYFVKLKTNEDELVEPFMKQ